MLWCIDSDDSYVFYTVMCPEGTYTSISNQGANQYKPCSGRGHCKTLRETAMYPDYITSFTPGIYNDWDADRIMGCVCLPGFQGPACEWRTCPRGDDPNTAGVNEIQIIDCTCQTCVDGITLTFNGQETDLIPYYATAPFIKMQLEALSTVDLVDVSMQGPHICSHTGSITTLTIQIPQGSQPGIVVTVMGGKIYNNIPSNNTLQNTLSHTLSHHLKQLYHKSVVDIQSTNTFSSFLRSDTPFPYKVLLLL